MWQLKDATKSIQKGYFFTKNFFSPVIEKEPYIVYDKKYDASLNVRYFMFVIESGFIYCMPEVGSLAHISFPSEERSDTMAVHAIRISGVKGSEGYQCIVYIWIWKIMCLSRART